ncbi:hypothetical protein A4A49_64045, partial [Nicotiana attenuata]
MKFGIQAPQQCVLCKQMDETFDHLFFDCSWIKALWLRLLRWLGYDRNVSDWQNEINWISMVAKLRSGHCMIVACAFGMMVHTIWRERNRLRFQGGTVIVNNICKEIAIHIHTK